MPIYKIAASQGTVIEPRREIPVIQQVDVLVVGVGTAGCAAALASARNGARTLALDCGGYVGGTGSAALMCLYTIPYSKIYGICREFIDELAERGGAVRGPVVPFDPEAFKQVALEKLQAAGVKLMFYTWTVGTIVDNGTVKGVIIENKSGRQAILAKVVIDASGDGDVAAAAGAQHVLGREADGKMRPMTVVFRMGPVDVTKIKEYRDAHPNDFSPDPGHNILDIDEKIVRLDGFFDIVRSANRRGVLDKNTHYLRLYGIAGETGNLYINTVRVYGVDGTKTDDLTRAQEESMRQIQQIARFVKEEIPGFADAVILETATMIGVRETRRILGDHVLGIEDCGSGRRFRDVVMTGEAHMYRGSRSTAPTPARERQTIPMLPASSCRSTSSQCHMAVCCRVASMALSWRAAASQRRTKPMDGPAASLGPCKSARPPAQQRPWRGVRDGCRARSISMRCSGPCVSRMRIFCFQGKTCPHRNTWLHNRRHAWTQVLPPMEWLSRQLVASSQRPRFRGTRARRGSPVPRGDRPRPGAISGEERGKRRGTARAPTRKPLISW